MRMPMPEVNQGHDLRRYTANVGGLAYFCLAERETIKMGLEPRTYTAAQSQRRRHAYDVLLQAEYCWDNLDKFRRERKRNIRYTYGDQWSDLVRDGRGRMVREDTMISRQGGVPLKNNMIRKLVNTVKGLYINQNNEPICVARDRDEQTLSDCLTELLKYVGDINDARALNADLFEEFIISGFVGCRKSFGWQGDRLDAWTTTVQADNFFVDTGMHDVRGWDCSMVGEIHDMAWGELLTTFAKGPKDVERIRSIYHYATDEHFLTQSAEQFGYRRELNASFLIPQDTNACRVIEVWNKERKARYHCIDRMSGEVFKCEAEDKAELVDAVNERRRHEGLAAGVAPEETEGKLVSAEWFVDNYWYYRFYAPTGEVLMEGETPYEHGEHPFVFRFYPFVNSEIHSFVADVIDVQRYVNRLINLNDFLLRTSAKGLLAIPDTALEGTGLTIEDIADVWAKPGGVYVYHAKAGVPLPTQITSSVQNLGIAELIGMEKQFFDEITGVNAALQGKSVGNVSGTYYAQQTQNAATSLQGLLTAFSSFIKQAATKDCKNIQQYYDTDRIVNIVGRDGRKVSFNPAKVKHMEYDINISESQSSPVFRQVANEFLLQVWQSGQISLKTMLEAGAFPFGDKLLSLINAQEQELAEQQAMMGGAAGVEPPMASQA